MADALHLEKMGRELKCPICLSLLSSAVSLTCNHVFCNLCIQKSMKSGLYCPVCKVPYQRREVRLAPHMDNLVNIYKSMEVASGISIFVSQNVPSTNISEGEKRTEGNFSSKGEVDGRESVERNHRKGKGKKSIRSSKLKHKNQDHNPLKPSFPTNKRVQVAQYPLPETPIQPRRAEPEKNEAIKSIPKSSAVQSERPTLEGERGPSLSPFFWLREEEDVANLSEGTDMDHLTDTPVNPPVFSDIKDSDDEIPSKATEDEEMQSKSNGADFFDSEMFEWTQRACSPDLLLSPTKMQVTYIGEVEGVQEVVLRDTATNGEIITDNPDPEVSIWNNSIRDSEHHNSSHGTKIYRQQYGKRELRKRVTKAGKGEPNKRAKKNMKQVSGSSAQESVKNLIQEHGCDFKITQSIFKVDTPKETSKDTPEAESPCEVYCKKSKKLEQKGARHEMNNEAASLKQDKQDTMQQLSNLNFERFDRGDLNTGKKSGDFSGVHTLKEVPQELSHKEEADPSKNNILVDRLADAVEGVAKVSSNAEAMRNVPENSDNENLDGLHEKKRVCQSNKGVLRKCEKDSTKTRCVFCHSAEETELWQIKQASGEMVHYFEGRPVSADYEGANIIHAHKCCTEWAPNVYFEDDVAINLEAELARSRRIKCSLCEVKGAALGCYERSCRKSFHVPCAKMVQQCRWDAENFVMLCPLHTSSKLPSEMCGSQVKRRKCNTKGQSQPQKSDTAVNSNACVTSWSSWRSSEKLVLCCSALTTTEKETLSDFEKASGITVSKNWNPSVTHVITSTNENAACRRTLKVLMGILEGKWILNIEWIKACMTAKGQVDETPYEINADIHGIRNGPRLGRQRVLNKLPKLFSGFKFYFTGDFVPSYKGYLQELITAAGGTTLHRKPIAQVQDAPSESSVPPTIVVYSLELPDKCDPQKKGMILKCRQSDAQALAVSTGSKVASNLWILNCIAGYKLQDLQDIVPEQRLNVL
ncbi:hypothetical protein Ancab_019093 [Ancistrocladus abbreviatus]